MSATAPVLFIRGGALGDFILTLPLLGAFRQRGRSIRLICRGRFRDLSPPDQEPERFLDLDDAAVATLHSAGGPVDKRVAALVEDAETFVFTKPEAALTNNLIAAGAARVVWLDSRPQSPPHVAKRFFIDAGLEPPPNLLESAIWPPPAKRGSALWIHPGSGSAAKNLPPAEFAEFARGWLQCHDGRVVVSFGEADEALIGPVERVFAERGIAFEPVVNPTLAELAGALRRRAARYVGNDSGVSHLASGLGIPSTIFFKTTDPRVWRPLGPCEIRFFPGLRHHP